MIQEAFQQFAIVQGDSAQQLSERLNEELFRLRHKFPEVSFEGMIARISYTEHTNAPEDTADEYELRGVHLTCQDCPFFQPHQKKDGSEDLRAKKGKCDFAQYGSTNRDMRACAHLFDMLNRGEVRLCLAE